MASAAISESRFLAYRTFFRNRDTENFPPLFHPACQIQIK